MVGKKVIDLSDVKTISDPRLMNEEKSNLQPQQKGPLPIQGKTQVKPEEDKDGAKKAALSKGNINDMAMTQELINKLAKEGANAGMGHEGG